MLPISRTSRLRPFARLLHSSSRLRSSAEAAPAARPAHFETTHRVPAIEAVAARRAKAGKLVAGVAAASDSDMFKGSVRRLALVVLVLADSVRLLGNHRPNDGIVSPLSLLLAIK